MAENNEIILDIKINTDEVAQKLATATKQVDLLKQEQQNLTKAFKEGRIADVAYAKAMAESKAELEKANREVKASTALLQAETMARVDDSMSLDEQRQALNAAQKAYALLSGEAKEAADAEGGLRDQIKALSDAVKSQEMGLGDARRNVGAYTESINQAFGGIGNAMEQAGQSANALSPAVGILRGMGGQAKKAGDILDTLGKVLQVVGNMGKQVTAMTKAQTVATEGQTVAQNGLNAAMNANPIGLIITGIATLLPLVQSFISAFGSAAAETEAFNNELARQATLIASMQKDAQFEAKIAGIMGASAREQLKILRDAAKETADMADAEVDRLNEILRTGTKKQKEAAREALVSAQEAAQKAWDELNALNAKMTELDLTEKKKSEDEKKKMAEDTAQKARELAIETAELERQVYNALAGFMGETNAQMVESAQKAANDIKKAAQDALAAVDEDESDDEEGINAMVARTFGFDDQALALYNDLLAQGVDAHEAANAAIEDMAKRTGEKVAGEMDKWLNQAMDFANQFAELSNALADAEMQNYQNEQDQKLKALDARLKKGLISEKEYNKQKEAIEAQTQRAENEAALKKAKQDKALAIMQAIISTAVGIAKAVSENPMMGGLPGSAIAAAMGAIQIATIAAQPLPQFATGGVVSGTSYTGDNVLARVNSGEMILNKQQQARLFDAISGNNGQSIGFDYELMAAAVANTPAPVVVYSELQEFGQKTTQYNEIASI